MTIEDFIYYLSNFCNFKPTHPDSVIEFIRSYNDELWKIHELKNKDYIIYLSGPVSGVEDYLDKFKEMEYEVYRAYSAYNVFVINPAKILYDIKDLGFDYKDNIFITLSLLYKSNILVYDNRDDKYKTSIGTNIELAYSMAKELPIYTYDNICNMNKFKDGIILFPSSNIVKDLQENNKEKHEVTKNETKQ